MISKLLEAIFVLVINLTNVILKPIDLLILTALPDLSKAIGAISNIFTLISDVFGWCISLTGLSSETLSLIVLYYTFALTVPVVISTIKLAIKWYNSLKI